MYNIIILIIANDEPIYYTDMQNIWKKYMNTHPNIKSFFIKGKITNQTSDIFIDDKNSTIHSNIKDSLIPGILIKTIKSFEYIYNNFDFKYIYRTNLSSFLNLEKMNDFAINNNFNYGAICGKHGDILFGSGCGFFISKEICDYIIKNKNTLDYNLYDDVAIGKLLAQKTDIYSVPRLVLTVATNDIERINAEKSIFHYRCKNAQNMHKTAENLDVLYKIFYT